jgi:(R,R)-butanediol dehydrogenase/meso-butanediol dehydrogenase/diacetyl reductase
MSGNRRARAVELGSIDPNAEDLLDAYRKAAGEARPRFVLECVGIPGVLRQAVDLASVRGRVALPPRDNFRCAVAAS